MQRMVERSVSTAFGFTCDAGDSKRRSAGSAGSRDKSSTPQRAAFPFLDRFSRVLRRRGTDETNRSRSRSVSPRDRGRKGRDQRNDRDEPRDRERAKSSHRSRRRSPSRRRRSRSRSRSGGRRGDKDEKGEAASLLWQLFERATGATGAKKKESDAAQDPGRPPEAATASHPPAAERPWSANSPQPLAPGPAESRRTSRCRAGVDRSGKLRPDPCSRAPRTGGEMPDAPSSGPPPAPGTASPQAECPSVATSSPQFVAQWPA